MLHILKSPEFPARFKPMSECEIFISYRCSDAAGHACALHNGLSSRFGAERVFFDLHSIESGQVFPDRLREAVTQCKVLLALMAPPLGGSQVERREEAARRGRAAS